MPGQIGWKSTEITLPVKGFRCQLNSTSRFGCKSIEITLPVKGLRSQWIYTQFDRALITGQIGIH